MTEAQPDRLTLLLHAALDGAQADLAFAAMTSLAPGGHAAIALDIVNAQAGRMKFLAPFFNNGFQRQQVVGLGSLVGFALGAVQSTGGNQGCHGVTSTNERNLFAPRSGISEF